MKEGIARIINAIDNNRLIQGNTTWNISYDTGMFMNTLIRLQKTKRMLEIGTSTGYSALWFLDALIDNGGHLITVESHTERYTQAQEHFKEAHVQPYVTQIKGHAPEIVASIEDSFDMLFFDATKMEHLLYWQTLEPKLAQNGIIITDNILSHEKELFAYKEYVMAQPNYQHSLIPIGTGLLLSIRINS